MRLKNIFFIRSVVACLLSLFFAQFAFAEILLPSAPITYISDEANIISPDAESILNGRLIQIDTDTSAQLVVATVETLQGYPVEEFAIELARHWGIGQKELDNGVLFLIAPNERTARIEVGYGLEGAITDAVASNLLQNVAIPSFKNGEYELGIVNTVDTLDKIIRSEPFDKSLVQGEFERKPWYEKLAIYLIICAIILPILLDVFSQSKAWWVGGVFGGAAGLVAGISFTWIYGILGLIAGGAIGLALDYIASTYLFGKFKKNKGSSRFGGFGGGGFGGGGGFSGGGGGFGGGGGSGSW